MLPSTYDDPQIEVTAESPRREMIFARLAQSGLRPIRACTPLDDPTLVPCLIDADSPGASVLHELDPAAVRRPVVLLGARAMPARLSGQVIHLSDDAQLRTLRSHLALWRRQRLRLNERALRLASEAAFGLAPSRHDTAGLDVRLLYVGPVSPFYMSLSHAIRSHGFDLVAAFSEATALDHLARSGIAGCLVDFRDEGVATERLEGLTQACGPRPLMAIASSSLDVLSASCLQVFDPAGEAPAIAAAIAAILHQQPPASAQPRRLSDTAHDPETRLHSLAFLRHHLPSQIEAAIRDETPLSLLCLRLAGEMTGPFASRAGKLTARLRETDLPCRTGKDTLIISLRDTAYRDAAGLARRLVENDPDVTWRVVERRSYHTADLLIQASLAGPFSRPVAA